LHPFLDFLISNIVFIMLQTLLSRMIFLVKALDPCSSSMNSSHFSSPLEDFLQKDINIHEEDILYNWTNMSSMSMLKIGKSFRVAKKFHPLTL
jgi:hypothetical protein